MLVGKLQPAYTALSVSDGYVFAGRAFPNLIEGIDVRDPTVPAIVRTLDPGTPAGAEDICLSESHAYVAVGEHGMIASTAPSRTTPWRRNEP